MEFAPPLIEGRLIRRYKRFLADVEFASGERVTAHCANPGSMTTCMVEGGRVWLSRSPNKKRKLPYTWEIAEVGQSLVCVNTGRANDLVAEALSVGAIRELAAYREFTREVRYGDSSRIDFLLSGDSTDGSTDDSTGDSTGKSGLCYVEVKSVTLDGGGDTAAFPDSVTVRGTKHLRELCDMLAAGHRAVLLFVCYRTGAQAVRPADEIDPRYGYNLRRARAAGLEILAYRTDISPRALAFGGPIPVRLPAFDYVPPVRRTPARGKRGAKKQVRAT